MEGEDLKPRRKGQPTTYKKKFGSVMTVEFTLSDFREVGRDETHRQRITELKFAKKVNK